MPEVAGLDKFLTGIVITSIIGVVIFLVDALKALATGKVKPAGSIVCAFNVGTYENQKDNNRDQTKPSARNAKDSTL